jgi:hypothetical protein
VVLTPHQPYSTQLFSYVVWTFVFLVVHLGVQILCFFSLSLDLVVGGPSKPPSSLTCVWNNNKLVERWTQILVAYKSYKKITFLPFCWLMVFVVGMFLGLAIRYMYKMVVIRRD